MLAPDDVLDSSLEVEVEVEVVDGSTFVVTPSVTTAPDELDPPLLSPLWVTRGGEEKQPANPMHSHTQCSNLMVEVSHSARRKKPPAPRPEGRRRGPRRSGVIAQRRDMKIWRMYQNSSATAENNANDAATCWLTR